ncbi:MAG: ABC transporter permease [Pseudomonadales bacterium]
MKATEQLDAMAVMGVNPLARVVAPRFWQLFSLPILTALFNVMGIIGGYYVGGGDDTDYACTGMQMQQCVDLV